MKIELLRIIKDMSCTKEKNSFLKFKDLNRMQETENQELMTKVILRKVHISKSQI